MSASPVFRLPNGVTRRTGGLVCALALPFFAACAFEDGAAPGVNGISDATLRTDIFALAHDSMAGRLVGSSDLTRASEWIRNRFNELGLEPAGDNGTYDQHFDLTWFSLGSGGALPCPGAEGDAKGFVDRR